MFICPYCRKDSGSNGKFQNWLAVVAHCRLCKLSTKEYYINTEYGPIHYKEFEKLSITEIGRKFPFLLKNNKIHDLVRTFNKNGYILTPTLIEKPPLWTKERIIASIQEFFVENGNIPFQKDFEKNSKYPHHDTVRKLFGSWNTAVFAAGLKPYYNDGFGTRTVELDGNLYRSRLEADFCNKWLFNKEIYNYEIPYPKPYRKRYDFFLPIKELYIEIDGGVRPLIIKEKIEINKSLDRNLLVLTRKDIDKFNGFT